MKKIVYYIITIFSITNYCNSQNPIIDLDEWNGDNFPNGSYYKDVNFVLNPFEGTWVYDSPNLKFEMVLEKREMYYNGGYYDDTLFGGYKVTKNGVVLYNFLNYSMYYNNPYNAKIEGNHIHRAPSPFDETTPGEIIMSLYMLENPDVGAELFLRKTTVNGQEAIQIYKRSRSRKYNASNGPRPNGTSYPDGIYTLIKQP